MKKNNENQTDSFMSFDPENINPSTGLNDEQVLKSRQIYGFNEIKKKKIPHYYKIFKAVFRFYGYFTCNRCCCYFSFSDY